MQNEITKRLSRLRKIMIRENLDAFYISGTDPHSSEYLCDHWKTRAYFTGFTGSFGEVVITRDDAGLWTDTRYFIQAENQLTGTGIKMHRLRVPEAVPPVLWLKRNMPPAGRLGVDPLSLPLSTYRALKEELSSLNIEIVFSPSAIDEAWTHRPSLPGRPIFELEASIAGESRLEKLQRISGIAEEQGATLTIISALDDLAWSFNLRGHDVEFNPVFLGYGIVGYNRRQLFIHRPSLPDHIADSLDKEGLEIFDYDTFPDELQNLNGEKVYLDTNFSNMALWDNIRSKNNIIEGASIPAALKAIKNATELDGFRQAMLLDGVAMVRFHHWLRMNVKHGQLTEFSIARQLAHFRSVADAFRGESFAPIVGYRDHGAIVHLSVDQHNAYPVQPEGILLFDSGGQYIMGTTDITRTVSLGPVSEQQKSDFTLVLKGMIKLSMAVFPEGTRGMHLDILARQSLWEHGLNYGHGTGHGVGHFLNVHEGPASIRQDVNLNAIRPGMVFSNEPGLYRTGEYGIRTENMMVCVEMETTPSGRFFAFETLTLCPIDTTLIEKSLLLPAELGWLNNYHRRVMEELMPLVPEDLRAFLSEITREI